MTNPLAHRLRDATRSWHHRAERAGVMAQLLRGQLPRQGYVRLLRNLQIIYGALEPALARHAQQPPLDVMAVASLARDAALRSDLALLHGARWQDELEVAPEAASYADRLHRLDRQDPTRLAAHAYVRYLGDLSGGQVLARVVGDGLGLNDAAALRFYDFGPAAVVARQARALRAALDAMPLTPAQADAVVDEACDAFARHCRLFEQLAH